MMMSHGCGASEGTFHLGSQGMSECGTCRWSTLGASVRVRVADAPQSSSAEAPLLLHNNGKLLFRQHHGSRSVMKRDHRSRRGSAQQRFHDTLSESLVAHNRTDLNRPQSLYSYHCTPIYGI